MFVGSFQLRAGGGSAVRPWGRACQVQRTPHLILLSPEFYATELRPLLARWLVIWLRANGLLALVDDEVRRGGPVFGDMFPAVTFPFLAAPYLPLYSPPTVPAELSCRISFGVFQQSIMIVDVLCDHLACNANHYFSAKPFCFTTFRHSRSSPPPGMLTPGPHSSICDIGKLLSAISWPQHGVSSTNRQLYLVAVSARLSFPSPGAAVPAVRLHRGPLRSVPPATADICARAPDADAEPWTAMAALLPVQAMALPMTHLKRFVLHLHPF